MFRAGASCSSSATRTISTPFFFIACNVFWIRKGTSLHGQFTRTCSISVVHSFSYVSLTIRHASAHPSALKSFSILASTDTLQRGSCNSSAFHPAINNASRHPSSFLATPNGSTSTAFSNIVPLTCSIRAL